MVYNGKPYKNGWFGGTMVGGFQYSFYMFYFHTENWGFMIQFDEHIFQMGGSTTTLYIYIYIHLPSGPDSLNNAWLAGTGSENQQSGYWEFAGLHCYTKPSIAWLLETEEFCGAQLPTWEWKNQGTSQRLLFDIQTSNFEVKMCLIGHWSCVFLVFGQMLCFSRFMLGCLMFVSEYSAVFLWCVYF